MRRGDQEPEPEHDLWALIDGDLSAPGAARVLDRVGRDPVLRARWARHHAVRSALEGARTDHLRAGFCHRLRQALDAEPAVLAPRARPPGPRPWLRPVAGAALAASVALVAMGGLFALQGVPGGGDPRVAPVESGGVDPSGAAGLPAMLTGEDEPAASQAARARIGIYLATHSEYAPAADLPGIMPYSRLSGFNAGQ